MKGEVAQVKEDKPKKPAAKSMMKALRATPSLSFGKDGGMPRIPLGRAVQQLLGKICLSKVLLDHPNQ
jgi:hypothetical protein